MTDDGEVELNLLRGVMEEQDRPREYIRESPGATASGATVISQEERHRFEPPNPHADLTEMVPTRTATSEDGGASWSSHGSYGECGWFRSGSGVMGAPLRFPAFQQQRQNVGVATPTWVDVERNRDLRGPGGQQLEDGTTVDSNFTPLVGTTLAVADLADAGILFPADLAGSVTMGVADFADAGILFPADTAGAVTADVAFLADAEEVTVGVTELADAGTVTADVALLADDVLVTMGVTDLTDAGAVPLAVTDMTFPEIGLDNMDVANEVNVAPREYGDGYGSFHGPALTDTWRRGEI